MATLPGGSCWSFCCCAAVLGVITLKPEATSMLSLFWVLLVVEQPAVNANRAMTPIMLNEVGSCFIFLGPFRFSVGLEMTGLEIGNLRFAGRVITFSPWRSLRGR